MSGYAVDVADSDAIATIGVQPEPVQRNTELPVEFEFAGLVQTKSISLEETVVAEMRVGASGAESPLCAWATWMLNISAGTPMNHIATLGFRMPALFGRGKFGTKASNADLHRRAKSAQTPVFVGKPACMD